MEVFQIIYIFLAFILAAAISIFHYFPILKKKKEKFLWIVLILRFLSVFLLLLLILNPKYKKFKTILKKPVLAIAIDNSSSISFLKQDKKAREVLAKLEDSKPLKKRFDVFYYTFGDNVNSGRKLSFAEHQTRINDLFTSFNKLYKDKSLATVLISDGNQTFGKDYSFQTSWEKHKVFPVLLGDTLDIFDLKISSINCNKYAFTGNKFPVELFLNFEGTKPVKAALSISNGASTVYNEIINFDVSSGTVIKTIVFQANKPGIQVYKAQLSILDQEPNKINNTKEFAIEVIDQRTEVLMVSDMLHPDMGTLKKSIESNEQRRVIFAKSNVSQEQLDKSQLVILYQPTTTFKNLIEKLATQKRNYLIITGKRTDWNFLNRIQNNFEKEWIRQTEEIQGEKNSKYTAFTIENSSFEYYPPLEGFLGEIRFSVPYETLVFERIRNVKMETPLLATYEKEGSRFGLLNGENIWKWRAHNFLEENNFNNFDSFLGKLVFYLSSDKKRERLTLNYEPFYDGSNELKIVASYFNKNYEFDKAASILLNVKNSATVETRKIPLVLKDSYYEADISTLPAGSYNFDISVEGKNISKSGNFRILEFDIEKQFLKADKERMQRLAEESQGKIIYQDQFKELESILLEDISFKPVQQSKQEIVSLIDFRYLLFLIIALLAAEWFLRKYKGQI